MGLVSCLLCAEAASVTITAEAPGGRHMAHYPSCWGHIEAMAAKARRECDRTPAVPPPARPAAIDAEVRDPRESADLALYRMLGNLALYRMLGNQVRDDD